MDRHEEEKPLNSSAAGFVERNKRFRFHNFFVPKVSPNIPLT
jgi:hypothetical protein